MAVSDSIPSCSSMDEEQDRTVHIMRDVDSSTSEEATRGRDSEQKPTSLTEARSAGEDRDGCSESKELPPRGHPLECTKAPEEEDRLDPVFENISILAHLAVFSMLGVCIRYGLEVLFGPRVLHVTDDIQALFLDIPPNMFGSFLMGIVGFVSKKDIAAYSQPLAIGLSTGLCGSITTFASWNERMMSILAYGLVARALFGFVLGTAVAYYSFLVGIDTAHAIAGAINRHNMRQRERGMPEWAPRPEHYARRWRGLVLFVALALVCWMTSAVLFALDSLHPRLKKTALACVLGPFGTWGRWYLSWQNGQGVGRKGRWKWVPVGTLSANLLAVLIEGATSAVDAVHDTVTGSLVVGALQLGLMGCLSTVSTLMQEVHVLVSAKQHRWRGYVYLYVLTILPSILIGIIVYCIPVWVFGVSSNGYNKTDPWDKAYINSEFT